MEPAPAQPPTHEPTYEERIDLIKNMHPSPQFEGNKALERLYRSNLIFARLALFTDHVRMANSDVNVRVLTKDDRKIQPHLSRYSNAIDDYKCFLESSSFDSAAYIELAISNCDHDLFRIASQTVAIEQYRQELEDAAPDQVTAVDQRRTALTGLLELEKLLNEEINSSISFWDKNIVLRAQDSKHKRTRDETREHFKKKRKQLIWKIISAVFGGFALIVPMLIMVFDPQLLTVTTTTSVSVLVVSVLLAAMMKDAGPKDVIPATAAYAAVLVVFVGGSAGGTNYASGNSSSMNNFKSVVTVALSTVFSLLLMMVLLLLWLFIATWFPGMPTPIPGVENPRTDEKGEPVLPIYIKLQQRTVMNARRRD